MVPFSIIFVGEFCVTIYTRGEGEEEKERKDERSWGALVPATPRR